LGPWQVALQQTGGGKVEGVGEVQGRSQRVVAPRVNLTDPSHYADPVEFVFPDEWLFALGRRLNGLQGAGK
jgi:hypothetical protein